MTDREPELKPCPWRTACCKIETDVSTGLFVRCTAHTQWMAAEDWNRRAGEGETFSGAGQFLQEPPPDLSTLRARVELLEDELMFLLHDNAHQFVNGDEAARAAKARIKARRKADGDG